MRVSKTSEVCHLADDSSNAHSVYFLAKKERIDAPNSLTTTS